MTSSQNELRVVLIGKTGNGKSSTGNSLLHSRSAFYAEQAGQSITKDCQVQKSPSHNGQQKTLTVVDTPGFFDTDITITNEAIERRIASQIFNMTAPGVHAFLIVIRIGRFTPEEKNTVNFIRNIFGQDAVRYCILVFTGEDQLDEGQSLEKFINTSPALRELAQACGNRTFAINNKLSGRELENKIRRLTEIIDGMVRNNNGNYYTNAEYQRIERQRREEQQRKEEEERRRKKAAEDAIAARVRDEEQKKNEEKLRKIREEDQRKAEQQLQKVRDEERQRADQRERELTRELDSARRSRRRDSDDDSNGSLIHALQRLGCGGNSMSPMNSAMGMPGPFMGSGMMSNPFSDDGMSMSRPMMRSASSGMSSGHGGRFTGEIMSTRGAANARPIYEGARGGQYYLTPSGNKSYIRK